MNWIDSVLGTIFYSVLVFMLGGMMGSPLWCWLKGKCPFMTKCQKC